MEFFHPRNIEKNDIRGLIGKRNTGDWVRLILALLGAPKLYVGVYHHETTQRDILCRAIPTEDTKNDGM